MARLTDAEKRQRAIEKQRAAMDRANTKRLAKLKDPVEIKKKREKQRQQNQRTFERAKEREKAKRNEPKPKTQRVSVVKPRKAIKSKGTHGRTATADEKRIADKIGKLDCICCTVLAERGILTAESQVEGSLVSLHHTDGRTKPGAHYKQLPLCGWHHQVDIDANLRVIAPYCYLVPVHATLNWGGKAQFNAIFGSEMILLERVYNMIGESEFFSKNILLSEVS